MDTSLLNLEEHFSTYYVYEEHDPSGSYDNKPYYSEWEDERELNGDIGLIPESSTFCGSLKDMSDLTDSPPSLLFQKMIDWSNFIYVDGVEGFPHEAVSQHLLNQDEQDIEQKEVQHKPTTSNDAKITFDDKEVRDFDLTTYINDQTHSMKPKPKVKLAGKKIDKKAQKYIVEDKDDKLDTGDEIDVETVLDSASLPVLEANDAFSLLEQFEASEKPILSLKHNENRSSSDSFGFCHRLANNIEMAVTQIPDSPVEIFEKVPQAPLDIFEEDPKIMREERLPNSESTFGKKDTSDTFRQPEQNKSQNTQSQDVELKHQAKLPKGQVSETYTSLNYVKSKQILEALPQELIARINESGKRKTITVIPPIPNKKRGSSRSLDSLSQHRNKISKTSGTEQIQFDHDYCAASSPYPKEPQKDSGFQSSEEDDRSVIRNQPTIKTADGKLMVSLLKVNTIRSGNNINNGNQKKKLNLEEYKKRRFITSSNTSLNNSPANSTCSSPLPEDETVKRIKHQEKLMKMAADLLNTPAKSTKSSDVTATPKKTVTHTFSEKNSSVPETIVPPPDLEVKTYVSIATNTDISSINCDKSVLASARQLEEIKPLLQKVSDKINSNSFITSLIENIPKAKTKTAPYVKSENQEVIREDKIIHFLKKDRLPIKTSTASCQTDPDEDTDCRYRRRVEEVGSSGSFSSRSSCNSTRRRRRSSSSESSQHSHSSSSSDSISSDTSRSSRSRSRSFSPKRPRQCSAEHLREVEERRVIYVGRIAKGTTKEDLRRRFLPFGPITNVSLHFRDYGDNYGFVTFAKKQDAYEAVEHGNDGYVYPKYDLSFGGRRIFCKTSYSDLDNMRDDDYNYYTVRAPENSFDALLRAAQEKIRKRKS